MASETHKVCDCSVIIVNLAKGESRPSLDFIFPEKHY